jgi:invasion protein IalB
MRELYRQMIKEHRQATYVPKGLPATTCRHSGLRILVINIFYIGLAMFMAFAQAVAAPKDGQIFKDWRVRCERPAEAEKATCYIFQDLWLRKIKQRLLHIAVAYHEGSEKATIILTLPLGILLPPGVEIQVDKTEPFRLAVEQCIEQGCQAITQLDAERLAAFKNGMKARVTFQDGKRRAITVPVSLRGFTAALNSLK